MAKFKKGDRVRSYGFGEFLVEAVYLEGGEVFYDLREVLSEILLKDTRAELKKSVPERFVYAVKC